MKEIDMSPIRWGVLGASKFAREFMAPAIHAAPGGTLAALATRDTTRAAPFQDFPLEMRKQYEQLEIIRTWKFSRAGTSLGS